MIFFSPSFHLKSVTLRFYEDKKLLQTVAVSASHKTKYNNTRCIHLAGIWKTEEWCVRANLFIKPRLTAYTANNRGHTSVGAASSISGPSDKRTFAVLRGVSRSDRRGPDNVCVCV